MSAQKPATPPSGPRGPGGPGPGGPGGHALVMPTAKPKDFKGALRRLGGRLRAERLRIAVVLVLAVISVTFMIMGPKILGNATNILFDGVVSKQIPPGTTKVQAVAGRDLLADDAVEKDVGGVAQDLRAHDHEGHADDGQHQDDGDCLLYTSDAAD